MPKESGEASCLVNGPFIEFEGQYHITKKGYIGCTHVQVFGQKSVIDVCENKMRIESASEIICKTKLIEFNGSHLKTMEAVYPDGSPAGPHDWTTFKEFGYAFSPNYEDNDVVAELRSSSLAD